MHTIPLSSLGQPHAVGITVVVLDTENRSLEVNKNQASKSQESNPALLPELEPLTSEHYGERLRVWGTGSVCGLKKSQR